jgi:lysozyme
VNRPRLAISALALSAAGFVGIVGYEGYSERAAPPVPGDVPTYGFGSTGPDVRLGDRIDPVRAVQRAARDVTRFEGAIKQCVTVPLTQGEYDAYVSLAYNIGPAAFCSSTLVRRLNAGDYDGACAEILRWDRFKGKPLAGLTARRRAEAAQCRGDAS